jgi:beta-glucanase (GH16 family)
MLIHPLVLAIVALAIGGAIGLANKLATHAEKPPAGRHAGSRDSKPGDGGLNGAHAPTIPPPGMHLAFDATFTGSSLDTQVWSTCYWYATPGAGCGHSGAYNESEWYLPTQDQVSHGVLNLVTSPVSTPGANAQGQPELFPCASGMVTTNPYFDFTYGYLQVVARIPKGRNTWPALWMLPANHATDLPEIDIMEIIGTQTNRPAVAFNPVTGTQRRLVVDTSYLSSGWHTYGLDWEPGSLTWFIDGKAVFAVTSQVPDQPMYLLANLAITNAFLPLRLPSSCTSSMSIRSVEVWQKTS